MHLVSLQFLQNCYFWPGPDSQPVTALHTELTVWNEMSQHDARCPELCESQQAFMWSSAALPQAPQVKRCFVIPHSITSVSVLIEWLKGQFCLCICSFYHSAFFFKLRQHMAHRTIVDLHWHFLWSHKLPNVWLSFDLLKYLQTLWMH